MAAVNFQAVGKGNRTDVVLKPWEVFDQEILPHLTLESVYGDLRLQRDGRFWQAHCPVHRKDREGAFSIDPGRLEWNCFLGCGGGGPIQYLEKTRGLSWVEAARELALQAGLDFSVLEPWQELWTQEDFLRHSKLEFRSSFLAVFITYARSVLRSTAGRTMRNYLIGRRGFPQKKLQELGVGFYIAPEDVWHYLKKAGRDLEEVRSWGLFDSKWAGCIVGPWKDLQGRIVNVWGWQPNQTSIPLGDTDGCTLFESDDPLGGKATPFDLEKAALLHKRDLLLVEGPLKALLARSLGLVSPFPVAAGGDLNAGQIQAFQDFLYQEGSLTVCWDYDPHTHGTSRDQTALTLQRLKKADFPVYVVDPLLMAGVGGRKKKVSLDQFVLASGGGDRGLHALQELMGKREAETLIQEEVSANEGLWPGVLDIFRGFSSRRSRTRSEEEQNGISTTSELLDPLFRAAEEIGRRLAGGFLKAMPAGLVQGWVDSSADRSDLGYSASGELPGLPAPASETLPAFSVQRLEEESGAASFGRGSGWRALDSLGIRFNPGELATIGARTGHGKTSMLVNLLVHWVSQTVEEETGELCVFCSMDEPEIRIYHRLLSLLTARQGKGWSVHQIEDHLGEKQSSLFAQTGLELQTLEAARRQVHSWEGSLQIICQPEWTITELKAYIQNLGNSRKLSAILVDHLHVPASIAERTNLDLPARRLAHGLKSLAVQAACPVISTVNIEEKQAEQI
ncbi:MAG: DnaB-like helicase C-terminal domain-containing protein, partial [Acidobacteriota bacterium]